MNTAIRPQIKPLTQLYPLPGAKADRKYAILSPDPRHVAICQPFMGSAARSLGSHLPSYLGDINAAHRAIAKAHKSPTAFVAAYNAVRDRLVAGIDLNLIANYENQRPLKSDHPEVFATITDRWKSLMAALYKARHSDSPELAGCYYFALKSAFGQVMRLNPTETGFNCAWHIDKLNSAICFNPAEWCLRMSVTPFEAEIYASWQAAIEAPPIPTETYLILDPPYWCDGAIHKMTSCYPGHAINYMGQFDPVFDLAIESLKQAIALGYSKIHLCNYYSPQLEQAIAEVTGGYSVAMHTIGECRSLGNSNGRLTHSDRKDGRDRPVEVIWEIVSVGKSINLPKQAESITVRGSAAEFGRLVNEPTEKQPLALMQQLIAALSGEVEALKAEGIAAPTQYLNEESKGDRNFYRLRWLVKGRVKSKSLKPSEVAEVRSRISRRNQVQALEQRIAEAHELAAKLEVIYANRHHC